MKLLATGTQLKRADWYAFWRVARKCGYASEFRDCDFYADKIEIKALIRKFEKDGQVRVSDRFQDCDHAVSTCTRLIPAVLVSVIATMDDIFNNAEGPGTAWVHSPEDTCDPDFRDLALEAFEDGHAHLISEVRYETH